MKKHILIAIVINIAIFTLVIGESYELYHAANKSAGAFIAAACNPFTPFVGTYHLISRLLK